MYMFSDYILTFLSFVTSIFTKKKVRWNLVSAHFARKSEPKKG